MLLCDQILLWPSYLLNAFPILVRSLIARFMGPTSGPAGADRTQVGPMLAPWTLLSGMAFQYWNGPLLLSATQHSRCFRVWPLIPSNNQLFPCPITYHQQIFSKRFIKDVSIPIMPNILCHMYHWKTNMQINKFTFIFVLLRNYASFYHKVGGSVQRCNSIVNVQDLFCFSYRTIKVIYGPLIL